jgi:hypothetical protein
MERERNIDVVDELDTRGAVVANSLSRCHSRTGDVSNEAGRKALLSVRVRWT